MNRKASIVILSSILSLSLFSCKGYVEGKIVFELNGGSFSSEFNYKELTGKMGEIVEYDIPDPVREGYEFVGWRTMMNGAYQAINGEEGEDGSIQYRYPAGTVTWYAYFEPQIDIHFDLTDGTEANGHLIAPENEGANFDSERGVLTGYTSKAIPSVSFLPTAEADNMDFRYWYTEYPLTQVTDEENGTVHYVLDENGEKGEYPFEQSFGSPGIIGSGMVFPQIEEGETFTLYAKWDVDPVLTIHYNLDGIADSAIPVSTEESLSDVIIETVNSHLEFDGAALGESGTQTILDGAKRFAGFYTDSALTTLFPLDTTTEIQGDGLELYVKWEDRIRIHLDYGEGRIPGKNESTEDIEGYYVGDVLGEEFLTDHTPSKADSVFSGFTLYSSPFDIANTPLPVPAIGNVLNFVATYTDYPELTLVIDYPDDKEDVVVSRSRHPEGSDISSAISSAIDQIEDGYAYMGVFQSTSGSSEGTEFGIQDMPNEDTTLLIRAGYPMAVHVNSLFGEYGGSSYVQGEIEGYSGNFLFGNAYDAATGSYLPESFDVDTLRYADRSLTKDGATYFYDGLYLDENFTTPFSVAASEVSTTQVTRTYWQKFTKAVTLHFYAQDGTSLNLSLEVLPGATVESFAADIENVLSTMPGFEQSQSYSLYVRQEYNGAMQDFLLENLPTTDADVYVHLL